MQLSNIINLEVVEQVEMEVINMGITVNQCFMQELSLTCMRNFSYWQIFALEGYYYLSSRIFRQGIIQQTKNIFLIQGEPELYKTI